MLNGLCVMVRHGISATFSFCTPDGQQVTYPLGSMYKHQLDNYTTRNPHEPATNVAWRHKTALKKDWLAAGFESAKQRKNSTQKGVETA